MRNFVQSGNALTLTAPYAVTSGQGALVGALFGVASVTLASGAQGSFQIEGVYDLTKLSAQAWTTGALIYWDNAARNCTTVPTGNKLIGVAAADAVNPSAVGRVRLNAAFIS